MTQLSLFESPNAVVVSPANAAVANPVPRIRRRANGERVDGERGANSKLVADSNRAVAAASPADLQRADLGHREGLNKMGDLARLVILRYELAAKRRHEMAARRAASLGR